MAPLGCTIRGRVWRAGEPQPNFAFDAASDYLAEPDTLIWVDMYDPDHSALTELASACPNDQVLPALIDECRRREGRA